MFTTLLRGFVCCLWMCSAGAALSAEFQSHPPMRPLPVASQREMGKGPAFYVSPQGDDGHEGSLARPWKTVTRGAKGLKPGDTLYLRGGVYHEHVTLERSGSAEQPITVRSYPGELAMLDGGLEDFSENPATAWEPCPSGVQGEYWSTKTYTDLGGDAVHTNLLGNFLDSMVPLQGYHNLYDLRSTNEYWNLEAKTNRKDSEGIYCGPGVLYDVATGRIHARLAHTKLKGLGEDNYRGEADPQMIALLISPHRGGPVLAIRSAQYLQCYDLVVRGARESTIDVTNCANVTLEGVTAYGGSAPVRVKDTAGFRLRHCALRGIAAPWTFRSSLKYRAIEARLFGGSGWAPTGADNRDFELAYSEFTDSVDGVFLGNVQGVRFHHNLVENVSDDGIFLTAATAFDGTTVGGDVHIYQNLLSRCLTTFAFGVGHGRQKTIEGGRQTGSGVYVYRNVFDFRHFVPYFQPHSADEPQDLTSHGRVAGDHGSPTWEPMWFYQNTVLSYDPPFRDYYGAGLGGHLGRGAFRRVFNNIFAQVEGLPGQLVTPPSKQFQADGNLHWSLAGGPSFSGEFLSRFQKSPEFAAAQKEFPSGTTAHDRFADPKFTKTSGDWRQPLDLTLQANSPAVNAGIEIASELPDPVRSADVAAPDIGAIPQGSSVWRVGQYGRLNAFGEQQPGATDERRIDTALAVATRRSPAATRHAKAVVVQGYPAFDAPIVEFALRKQHVAVEMVERTWLPPAQWSGYSLVAIAGDLVRAKIEPNKFTADELKSVKAYLEQGGTLLLMRGTTALFGTPEGKSFLAELTAAPALSRGTVYQVRQPEHAWVKSLASSESHPWLESKNVVPISAEKGDTIIGTDGGRAILYRLPVGKGQLIYFGWEIANSLPAGRKASTVEDERVFEEQVKILTQVTAELFPLAK